MQERLEQIEERYEELSEQLSSRDRFPDQAAYTKAAKQHRALGDIVTIYREVKAMNEELAGAREMYDEADDDEMREMA
ncbi:MAG: PCRF domain-containing protein, partial [Pyrinomonadaceae bacterium]